MELWFLSLGFSQKKCKSIFEIQIGYRANTRMLKLIYLLYKKPVICIKAIQEIK